MAVTVFPDILSIFQQTGNKIQVDFPAPYCGKATFHKVLHDLFHSGSIGVPGETLQHHGGGVRVDLIAFLFVDDKAKGGRTTIVFAFQSVLRMAPDDFLGQLGGVVFRHALQHTFQNNALRALGNVLRGRQHLNAIFPKLGFIVGAVVAVTGEAVKFPDDDNIKEALGAVLNHALEVRAVVSLGRHSPVNVCPQDAYIVLLAVGRTFPQLALNTFLTLVVTGIPGVNHGFHFGSPSSMIRNSASFRRLLTGAFGSKHISINALISRFCSVLSCSAWGW